MRSELPLLRTLLLWGLQSLWCSKGMGKWFLGFGGGVLLLLFFSEVVDCKLSKLLHTPIVSAEVLYSEWREAKERESWKKWSPTPSFLSVPNLTSHLLNFLNSTVSLDADQATRMRPHFIFILYFSCLFVVEGLSLLINCVVIIISIFMYLQDDLHWHQEINVRLNQIDFKEFEVLNNICFIEWWHFDY